MADGEINVSVRADGVDDAAGELGGEGGVSGGGGRMGDGRGQSGGQQNEFTKLLTRIATLLVFLGPILEAVGTITTVLTAFVAPLAIVLMRLIQPALRLLISVLPAWFDMVEGIDEFVDKFGELSLGFFLAVSILRVIHRGVDGLRNLLSGANDRLGDMRDWLGDMLDTLRELPSNIANSLPSAGDVAGRARDGIGNALLGDEDSRRRQAVNIGIGGGLEPFIDRLTRNGSVDFP